jgi:hypothetical protein
MKELSVIITNLLGFAGAMFIVITFFGAESFFALIDGLFF